MTGTVRQFLHIERADHRMPEQPDYNEDAHAGSREKAAQSPPSIARDDERFDREQRDQAGYRRSGCTLAGKYARSSL